MTLLKDAVSNQKPVSFFGLVCQKENVTSSAPEHGTQPKITLKTCRDKFTFEICNVGSKAERLKTNAKTLIATDRVGITVVSELATYTSSSQNIDYATTDSNLTVCRLLKYAIEAGPGLMEADIDAGATEHTHDKDTKVFQINHARMLEPKANENLLTKGGDRLFPTVRIIDSTGTVELKMREKTALALAGTENRELFTALAAKGALNFPILCSLRVSLTKQKKRDEHGELALDAIVVEAEAHDLVCPRGMPNASMDFVTQLLQSLSTDMSRMVAAPLAAVRCVRHAGMVVDTLSTPQMSAACVLSLVAHLGRSIVNNLPGGAKLISSNCWNVPFEDGTPKDTGAPEHTDKKIVGQIASYCTADNVQDVTLTTRRPKETVYALIVVSGVHVVNGVSPSLTYMIDKVDS